MTRGIIAWSVFNTVVFFTGFFIQKYNNDLRVLNIIGYSVLISRGFGLCLAILPLFIFLPMCKKSITKVLIKIPKLYFITQYLNSFHKLAGRTSILFSMIHSFSHYINFYNIEQRRIIESTMVTIHYYTIAGISGHFMLVSLFFIGIFSINYTIKNNYKLFSAMHMFYIIYCIGFLFHGTGCFVRGFSGKCYPYYSYLFMTVPLVIFLIEMVSRLFIKEVNIISSVVTGEGLKIVIDKQFDYMPGMYAKVCVPSGAFPNEWHPISISSADSLTPSSMEFSIKRIGDWSTSVRELVLSNECIKVKVDGPYISPCSRHSEFKNLIFISSGIGITPFISIIKDFAVKYTFNGITDTRMDIYWVSRYRKDLEWFETVFSDLADTLPCNILNINIHITEPVLQPETVKSVSRGLLPIYDKLDNIFLNHRRPNFDKLISEYSSREINSKVGVFVCGNKALSDSVIKATKKHSNNNVSFETILEVF